jgi:peptide/nickel transport system ATP-binding protein
MSTLLEARQVSKVFGGGLFRKRATVALDHFSFSVDSSPPTITAIVGESGSGKTTLARLLLGLVSPSTGEVLYDGTNIRQLAREGRKQFLRDVQMIFQDPYEVYNPFYRVEHVLEAPISHFKLAKSEKERRALIENSLRAVGLRPEETLGRYPHQLSGGQRQRIMVARAVLIRPRLILADEPVSMVDASLRATILDSLRELNREYGMSIVYITHDLTTAYQISDNIIVLYRGAVTEAGAVDLVVSDPRHPYTQLLIDSVPAPDPEHHWGAHGVRVPVVDESNGVSHAIASDVRTARRLLTACPFVDRCPHVMPVCHDHMPPLYRLDATRAAACFLYRSAPSALAADQLNEVIRAHE